jgi:ribosome-binding factor A
MSHRLEKVNDLIRDSVAQIIAKHLSIKKGVFVSVAKVDTSKDLRYARVFISVFPKENQLYVEKTLRKEIYDIQGLLNKSLSMRPLPRIKFVYDDTQQRLGEIEDIFDQIKKEREQP